MSEVKTFTGAVVACLISNAPGELESRRTELTALVARILDEVPKQQPDRLHSHPSRTQIDQYLADIRAILPQAHDSIALVAGGATKIKDYVFEAPKLPEIRGASALLDWVNEVELPRLWDVQPQGSLSDKEQNKLLAQHGIIYASGGGFLAFAPAGRGAELATAVERCYTEHTLTANSVAVSQTFSLLELRYGRLIFDENEKLTYWADTFLKDWKQPDKRYKQVLQDYYYYPFGADKSDDSSDEAIQRRFYNRKTFGELVTLLATMTNRRRSERTTHGETRSIPFYALSPWDAKCDSSDVRPVVVTTLVGTDQRALSAASGRKLVAGRIAKGNVYRITNLEKALDWQVPNDLISWGRHMSWERRWEAYLHAEGRASYCGQKQEVQTNPRPAKDVHEIGTASNGYIGIIYADGNNVGRLIATLTTPENYAGASKALSNAARLAVFKSLASYIEPIPTPPDESGKPFLYPFEILAIGGDDLFLIVPGNKAFEIALAISRNFEQSLAENQKLAAFADEQRLSTADMRGRYNTNSQFSDAAYKPSIGLSAGVIIAQENAPIFFLRDLVEELLKSAKGLAKENAKQCFFGGAVDFMVMKSITMVTDKIKTFRRQALGDDGKDNVRRLTARPYTWHEFAGLLETVRQLKQARVPRSQLYRLRSALDAEPGNAITPSVMEYLYTRVRMQKRYSDVLQKHIEQHWCWSTPIPHRTGGLPPWMPLDKRGWETIWPDLLEVYEMVPEQTEEQQ